MSRRVQWLDCYEVLGISFDAKRRHVRKAFRRGIHDVYKLEKDKWHAALKAENLMIAEYVLSEYRAEYDELWNYRYRYDSLSNLNEEEVQKLESKVSAGISEGRRLAYESKGVDYRRFRLGRFFGNFLETVYDYILLPFEFIGNIFSFFSEKRHHAYDVVPKKYFITWF